MDIVASSLGGAIIGASAGALWLLHGRIAGISGITGRLVKGCVGGPTSESLWRFCFVLGLLAGGFALHQVHPAAFPRASFFSSSPDTDSTAVVLLAGLLVGYGTQLGNGCTSGHGVCGLARFSVRSLAATLTFMLTGALTAIVSRTTSFSSLNLNFNAIAIAPLANTSLADLLTPLSLASAAFLLMSLAALAPLSSRLPEPVAHALAALPGFTFAIGLGLSGMTHPAKVRAFLDPFGAHWDPSLMFVMGGALTVNAAVYAVSQRPRRRAAGPYLSRCIVGCRFDAPTATQITPELIVGAAMFGVGWGLAGRCPGPALISTVEAFFDVQQARPALVFLGSMLAGVVLHHFAPLTFSKAKGN